MKKLTVLQKITIGAIILYIFWEFIVQIWEITYHTGGPVIRVDLVIIYPVLVSLVILSFLQMIFSHSKKK